jgi:D-lactate dehydrogenase
LKTIFYSVEPHDFQFQENAHQLIPLESKSVENAIDESSIDLAFGFEVVSSFGTDSLPRGIIEKFKERGVKAIAQRCVGVNAIDLEAAKNHGIEVFNVPKYSPEAIAEHVVAMILNLSRRFHISYNHIREGNFSISPLLGFNLNQKVFGILGAGHIGTALAKILTGFNCKILACDPCPNQTCLDLGVEYVDLDTLLKNSDIISLNLQISEKSYHIIDAEALKKMKKGVTIINTGRGGLIDTDALIEAIKSGHIGHVGLDVYEWEQPFFHKDLSDSIITNDHLARLLFFPNVIITSHQAYFTKESLTKIWNMTYENIHEFICNGSCKNKVEPL